MNDRILVTGVLVLAGAGWGLGIPLAKLSVSTGYQPFGLIFWQVVIVSLILGTLTVLRGKSLPLGWPQLRVYAVIAALGAVLPDIAYYLAAVHLQAGVMAILTSAVPLFAFPIALALGNDRFVRTRLLGLALGLSGILLLIGPQASLPDASSTVFVLIILIAPLCYACEVNVVVRWGIAGMDPLQALTGASLLGTIVILPVTVATGQFISPWPPYDIADFAMVLNCAIHAFVYATYVWLAQRAGSVFASQTAYLVTGFGVLWSILLLGEIYSGYIWLALLCMLGGMFLVQPRAAKPLAPVEALGDTIERSPKGAKQ